ncbi:MAG: Hpt domain-containing protein [Bacteroidia bacterium]|nr:Hpt domain-containing protein [Bacteroidia bacterium]MBP9178969.1 Hpt domain-containing protein [Bacteroidia bacterium]MBP9723270.1 Hpt domain-containing protein [Bacteroidia bacterium]
MVLNQQTLAQPLLDDQRISRLKNTDEDHAFYIEMVELFELRTSELIEEISKEINGERKDIKPQLHKLKGISFSLGANRLAEVCKELEVIAEQGNIDPSVVGLLTETINATLAAQKAQL